LKIFYHNIQTFYLASCVGGLHALNIEACSD
jgi:hypothetical protein